MLGKDSFGVGYQWINAKGLGDGLRKISVQTEWLACRSCIIQAHPEETHFQTPGHFDTNLPDHLGSLLVSGLRGEMQKGSALHFVRGPGVIWICGGN